LRIVFDLFIHEDNHSNIQIYLHFYSNTFSLLGVMILYHSPNKMARKLGIITLISGHATLSLAQSSPLAPAGQTTTISAFLWDTHPQPLFASVIAANPTATTYGMACPDCGINLTVFGDSVFEVSITANEFTESSLCTVSEDAVCYHSLGGKSVAFPGSSMVTISEISITSLPITVTAGVEKLSAAEAAFSSPTSSAAGVEQTSDDDDDDDDDDD
jgi:hypothetical protein